MIKLYENLKTNNYLVKIYKIYLVLGLTNTIIELVFYLKFILEKNVVVKEIRWDAHHVKVGIY